VVERIGPWREFTSESRRGLKGDSKSVTRKKIEEKEREREREREEEKKKEREECRASLYDTV